MFHFNWWIYSRTKQATDQPTINQSINQSFQYLNLELSPVTSVNRLTDSALPQWPVICDLSEVIPYVISTFSMPSDSVSLHEFLVLPHFLGNISVRALEFYCYPVWFSWVWLLVFPSPFCIWSPHFCILSLQVNCSINQIINQSINPSIDRSITTVALSQVGNNDDDNNIK